MTTWAILPVKPFYLGKSRLHSFLDKEEIYHLNRDLFTSTYRRLEACHEIDKILVITRDEEILKLVDEWGGVALAENTSSSLNLAISQAFAFIQESEESGPVLVIPADLPRMKTEDLDEMLALAKENGNSHFSPRHGQETMSEREKELGSLVVSRPRIMDYFHTENCWKENRFLVIVPDYNQTGTNALYMSRPALIKPMFGRRSFQKHIRQALVKSINLTVWLNNVMQYDLDTHQDLQKYNKINHNLIETIY
jgi:2-phospho-L-lactate guanylyltransferase (CobY/MobA/RfbA family)